MIFSNEAGFVTRLRDIAKVTDTFEEAKILERINKKNAIVLQVSKKSVADMIDLNDRIKVVLNKYKTTLPADVSLFHFNDYSRFVATRLHSLITNAIVGFALLALVLVLMLGFRMTLIVGVSIPIAFMIAFIEMKNQNITLNVISMFALVMVLGMIVDFAIVVSENAFRYLEQGMKTREAVMKGVSEVTGSMTTTLLCITTAFAPLLFVSGLVGKFIIAIPLVIIICLTASWVSALFILPCYLDSFAKPKKHKNAKVKKIKPSKYKKMLSGIVTLRYPVVIGLFVLFGLSLVMTAKYIDFVFMPSAAKGIFVKTQMSQGTNLSTNKQVMLQLEKIIATLPKEEMESFHTRIGTQQGGSLALAPKDGTHRGTIVVHLTPSNDRDRNGNQIVADLRKRIKDAQKTGQVDSRLVVTFELDTEGMPPAKPINVEIRGNDLTKLRQIADEYIVYLKTIDGVYDIGLDLETGKTEYRYEINEELATRAGLSVKDIAQTLHIAYKGAVATTLKKGDEEIDLRVRFPNWARKQETSLDDVLVANPQGGLIPLSKVTTYKKQKGFVMINRKNYKRIAQVQANIDPLVTNTAQVNRKIMEKFASIQQKYPGYSINYGGETEDTKKSLTSLAYLFIIAIILIYVILASLL